MGESAKSYPRHEHLVHRTSTVLQHKRIADKVVEHPREQPGNIIIIHGVNDVGTSYRDVEEGLCAGLEARLFRHFMPAPYSIPNAADKVKVVGDPDAVYFKRKPTGSTSSPVIPFYWGYREAQDKTRTVNGQRTDRYGNRLDKDLSKGGGPFGNATSTLPDMWYRGIGAPLDPVGDPLRPLRTGPGRMYMILAAQRLAALVAMIRQYEAKDTVTIVAHSQGCLISLLAQALLMERGEKTADTLILMHPPYSLDEEISLVTGVINAFAGGADPAMDGHYDSIRGSQSLHARLQTLVNIVHGVAKARSAEPAFTRLNEADCGGMLEGRWKPDADRDNRGKVYLYFSPEDMTVALDNIKGIGWQGIPDYIQGTQYKQQLDIGSIPSHGTFDSSYSPYRWVPHTVTRKPLSELGAAFRQRVFTGKQRFDPHTRKVTPELVGSAPHDFALRIKGEDDHAHVESSGRSLRASLPVATWPIDPRDKPDEQRHGIRAINGEALRVPCQPDMHGSQVDADKIPASSDHAKLAAADRGPCEEVDPITAAIALTSGSGLRTWREQRPDPSGHARYPSTPQDLPKHELDSMSTAYSQEKAPDSKDPDDRYRVVHAVRYPDGTVMAAIQESPNAARLRWQHELGAKSFHSAIFDSSSNHCRVTAYDLAIGSGKASSDPKFLDYLCVVADWRLKKPGPNEKPRHGILTWNQFLARYRSYLECEPQWRNLVIEGSADYYSSGVLPQCLPLLTGKLCDIVVSETTSGKHVAQSGRAKGKL